MRFTHGNDHPRGHRKEVKTQSIQKGWLKKAVHTFAHQ
nr:MAG TPA: hypothetical protein [Caudoviricetes sp.]